MRLVEGVHREDVQRYCLDFRLGKHCFGYQPGGPVAFEGRSTPVSTCMDEYEWPNRKGATPVVMLRYVEAEAECGRIGKRLCTEFEWELACEGPELLPWPYGYAYDPTKCNTDKRFLPYSEKKLQSASAEVREAETQRVWQGAASGAFPGCRSAFGIRDQIGNVEEWVKTSRPEWPHPSALKGGFWAKARSHCRGTNDSHGPTFRYYEIGFRCCKDPQHR